MKELLGTLDLWQAPDVEIDRAVLIRAFGSRKGVAARARAESGDRAVAAAGAADR
jgi:hypothetical protein